MFAPRPPLEWRPESFRWWYLPCWLGLDAPLVALTWTWAISQAAHLVLRTRTTIMLFLVVWSIYLLDRLIDVARCKDWKHATGRLRFGRCYPQFFWTCLVACIAGMLATLWLGLRSEVVQRGVMVFVGVCLNFLVFVVPVFLRRKLPGKELGVGLFFAFGAYACLGGMRGSLPLYVSFGLVVAFNCLVIASRDAESDRANDPGGASHWWLTMHRDLLWIGTAFTCAALVAAALVNETSYYLSLAAAFGLLTTLQLLSRRLSGDAVRSLADFALLTPLPVMGLMQLRHAA
jgi:hypothetical protein